MRAKNMFRSEKLRICCLAKEVYTKKVYIRGSRILRSKEYFKEYMRSISFKYISFND